MNDPRHPSGQQPQSGIRPAGSSQPPSIRPSGPGTPQPARPMVNPQKPAPLTPDDLEPIALVDEDAAVPDPADSIAKKIRALGEVGGRKHHDWKRKPVVSGRGSVRVRSFHGKYSDQGLQYLDDAINEWLDANPEVEVKFVTSTVGVFEGKIREPALVLNVWY